MARKILFPLCFVLALALTACTPAEVLTSPAFRSVFHLDLGLHPNGEGGAAQ